VKLGWLSPFGPSKVNPAQASFLKAAFRPQNGVCVTHLRGGRGVGKTSGMMLALLESALNVNPGLPHCWSGPTYDSVRKSFLQKWYENVPKDLYTIIEGKHVIYLKNAHGEPTPIYFEGRNSRSNYEGARSEEWACLCYDEPRQDRTSALWLSAFPTVRHPRAKKLLLLTGSTPIMSWWSGAVQNTIDRGAVEVVGSSYDNPHLDREGVEQFEAQLDKNLAAQEVWGQWVTLGNQIWDGFVDEDWPLGNRHPHRYDPSLPYIVAADLGVWGAWLIIQTVRGYGAMGNSPWVDVVVGEYTTKDGNSEAIARRIFADYGKQPSKVITGSDVNTREIVTGHTTRRVLQGIGWTCPIIAVDGPRADKDLQYNSARHCLTTINGQRTFCISKHLVSHERTDRGILDVMFRDAWPDKGSRQGSFLPKDKGTGLGLEDSRDAFLYYAIVQHPLKGYEDFQRDVRNAGIRRI